MGRLSRDGESARSQFRKLISGLSIGEKGAVLKSEFETDLPARLREKEGNMCNYSEFVENRGRKEGRKEGRKKGRKEGKAEALVNLMKNLKWNLEQALRGLSIPESEWDDYREMVKALEANSVS